MAGGTSQFRSISMWTTTIQEKTRQTQGLSNSGRPVQQHGWTSALHWTLKMSWKTWKIHQSKYIHTHARTHINTHMALTCAHSCTHTHMSIQASVGRTASTMSSWWEPIHHKSILKTILPPGGHDTMSQIDTFFKCQADNNKFQSQEPPSAAMSRGK